MLRKIFLLPLVLLAGASSVLAENSQAASYSDPDSQKVFSWCEGNHKAKSQKDCACLAETIVDVRKEMGADASFMSLQIAMKDLCRNYSSMREQQYDVCISGVGFATRGDPVEDYCACYADKFIKRFKALPVVEQTRLKMTSVRRTARNTCFVDVPRKE